MHIIIVDRDRISAQILQTRLEEAGHSVVVEAVRKTALDMLQNQDFDVVMIDPAPLPSVRQFVLPLRWEQSTVYLYMVLLSHELHNESDVVRNGMNAQLVKPYDWQQCDVVLYNASRFTDFMKRLRASRQHMSDSHIFGQQAFYQLVLSALDRAYRYGEQAYLLSISLMNVQNISQRLGDAAVDAFIDELGTYLSHLHRMSDFLGRTDRGEYVLLLLRPAVDTEPQDAADRFALALNDFIAQASLPIKPAIDVELWALPSSQVVVKKQLYD